jgi:predicted amidohydrolase
MLVKVALVQHAVGDPLSLDLKLHLYRQRPDFVCFPEYWGARAGMTGQSDLAASAATCLAAMSRLSSELFCTVIGGTVVQTGNGSLSNSAPVFSSGQQLGIYTKTHPTERERERGVVAGNNFPVWSIGGVRVAVAICADCLFPEVFDTYGEQDVDLLFVPNASPYRPDESTVDKFARDESIFVDGSKRAGAYVIKACGVGTLFGGRLQGRSLVAAPWGVLHRVPPEQEHRAQVISVCLSLDELREFRQLYRPAAMSQA